MTKTFREYDLNVFYAEDYDVESEETTWDQCYTIQPSVYQYDEIDQTSTRVYLEAFKISLEETRAIAPDFPEEEWGSDFFITLDTFYDACQALPGRVKQILSTLPPLDEVPVSNDEPELKWLNTLFV